MDLSRRLAAALAQKAAPDLPPPEAAKAAGLRYVRDDTPGITRCRLGDDFVYRDAAGAPIRDADTLARIKALAVPPAWVEVWICPDPRGHLQATGRDARGRKQYRYHPRWREQRDETKYEHMLDFGKALPRLRRRVEQDLSRPGLPREKVLAAVVRLMESTLARVGNVEYARDNGSFGLTTLQNRHMRIAKGRVELDFRAKHGIRHRSVIADRRLARILRNCRDLPGSELFQYLDEAGERRSIDSGDVNAYLRDISGAEITAKDFRTWAATSLALLALGGLDPETPTKQAVVAAVKQVAEQLGNTPSVCRKCYIHPLLLESYATGKLAPFVGMLAGGRGKPTMPAVERVLMHFLAAGGVPAAPRARRAPSRPRPSA
jgi:DNA topoisomerase I